MADSIVIATAESTPGDMMAPNCFSQFEHLSWNLGHITRFDNNNGAIILSEGSNCWAELRDWFTDATTWLDQQLKMADQTDIGEADDMKELALEVASIEDVTAEMSALSNNQGGAGIDFLIQQIEGYTDYQLVVSMWAWDNARVQPGQSAGLCLRPSQPEDAYASCWVYERDQMGAYGKPKSLMVEPSLFTPGARLEEMPALENYPIPGMKGSWMCSETQTVLHKTSAMCIRFIPKTNTIEDPLIDADSDITLMTYLSSRFDDEAPEGPIGTDAAQEGFHVGQKAFEDFNFNLQTAFDAFMGASYGISAASAAVLVTAAATLAF